MIKDEIKNIKKNHKEWRKFGLTVGIALGLLGFVLVWRGKNIYPYFFIVSMALILAGLIAPKILNPIHRVWMTAALLMGWVMSHVLLTIIYFLVITSAGLLLRILGKDFLNQKLQRNKTSYWLPRNSQRVQQSDYEKQF